MAEAGEFDFPIIPVYQPQLVVQVEEFSEEEDTQQKEITPLVTLQWEELPEESAVLMAPNEDTEFQNTEQTSCVDGFYVKSLTIVQNKETETVLLEKNSFLEFNYIPEVLKVDDETVFTTVRHEEIKPAPVKKRSVTFSDVLLKNKKLGLKDDDVQQKKKKVITALSKKPERTIRPCPICQKTFSRSESVQRHIRVVHNPQRPIPPHAKHPRRYPCSKCDDTFSVKSEFDRHIRMVHVAPQPIPFDAAFSHQRNLARHVNSTHDNPNSLQIQNPVQCPTCSKSYITLGGFQRHLKNSHATYKFPCPLCPEGFSREMKLLNHRVLRHGYVLPPSGMRQCAICLQVFTKLRNLRRHEADVHSLKRRKSNVDV